MALTADLRARLLKVLTLRQFRTLAQYHFADKPPLQEDLGRKFGISQQAISRRLGAAEERLERAGLKMPHRPGGRAPKHIGQLSAYTSSSAEF